MRALEARAQTTRIDHVPNSRSADKRLRQSRKRRERNRTAKSAIRTQMRKLFEMDSAEEAQTALRELYTMLDRAAARHVLHPNTAARRKARLARHVRQLSA